jgi:hypothetical protein
MGVHESRATAWLRLAGAFAALAIGAAAAEGCGSSGTDETHPGGPDAGLDGTVDGTVAIPGEAGGDDTGSVSDGMGVVDAGPLCDPEASVDVDCTGKCGPVKDMCGHVTMCGGCQPAMLADGGMQTLACDLTTNTCVIPKVTCTELNAQCGTVQDTCGDFLDCPDTNPKGCPAGQECNNDTHQCQACEQVTCADLGYQCGFAWLGCGPDTSSNFTDCGSCPAAADGGAQVCNPVFNTCEPKCTPGSAATVCAAAKAASGVECGFISDGCGGIVDCDNVTGFGCASGQSCGVRGIANHCDPYETPAECVASGKNCGDITSACTGLTVHCGDCPAGQTCNSNQVCGPACVPKTCADYSTYECGTFDDGCGGTVTCGTCPSGTCEQTSNTCCPFKQCATDYAGQCGTALPNGCGSTVNCACTSGSCTVDGGASGSPDAGAAGECCVPHAATFYTGMGECGTNLPDGCGKTVNATCPSGQECVSNTMHDAGAAPTSGVVGTCCAVACNLAAGTCGSIQDSCRPAGTMTTCNKCASGTTCNSNTCCHPAPACNNGTNGEGAECNDSKQPVDTGCGSARACTCSGSRVCWCGNHVCGTSDGAGSCKTPTACPTQAAGSMCGTTLDNGTGGTITCGCPSGYVCSSTTAGTAGTCMCSNGQDAGYKCTNVPGGPGQTGGDQCGAYSNGCGGTLNCTCPTGQSCNTTPNPNVCCTPPVCATPGIGSACGTITNSCTSVNCSCPSGTGKENFACTGGVCACTPDTCRGRTGAQPDRCGGTLQCGG